MKDISNTGSAWAVTWSWGFTFIWHHWCWCHYQTIDQIPHIASTCIVTFKLSPSTNFLGKERISRDFRKVLNPRSKDYIAQCKGIRIPESGKFLLVESGIREKFAFGIWNPEKFACGIRNQGKVCMWNPESWALESVIQLKESGILFAIGIQNPSSTDKDWNPVPRIRNPWRGIQTPRLPWIPSHWAKQMIRNGTWTDHETLFKGTTGTKITIILTKKGKKLMWQWQYSEKCT